MVKVYEDRVVNMLCTLEREVGPDIRVAQAKEKCLVKCGICAWLGGIRIVRISTR